MNCNTVDICECYLENCLLDKDLIDEYDIELTKNEVKKLINKYQKLKYKYINIPSPKITTNYEIKYECFTPCYKNNSYNVVDLKLDTEIEIKQFYSLILEAINQMNKKERIFFYEKLMNKKSEDYVAELLNISRKGLQPIKNSCIIKFALVFNIEVIDNNNFIKGGDIF